VRALVDLSALGALAACALLGACAEPSPSPRGGASDAPSASGAPAASVTSVSPTASVSPSSPSASALAATEPPCPPLAPWGSALVREPPLERADLDPTPERVEAALRELAKAAPCDVSLDELTRTHGGRPVLALTFGRAPGRGASPTPRGEPSRPSLLVMGGIHGDEPLSVAVALDLARRLATQGGEDPVLARALRELRVVVVPLLNPDGLTLHRSVTPAQRRSKQSPGRKNGRDHDGDGKLEPGEGVDLNRNYPFRWGALGEAGSTSAKYLRSHRGPGPASEPETKAIVALAERERFVASLSLHVGTAAILVPYTIPGVKQPKPNEAWLFAEELSRALPQHPDVPKGQKIVVQKNLYPVDGTDQDHLRHAHGTLALLIECALRSDDPVRAPKAMLALRPVLPVLAARVLDGPSVTGRVLEPGGAPALAEVRVEEQALFEGERWMTRARDGAFARILPKKGRVTVRATAADGRTVSKIVDATGRVELTLELPPK
jgi:hypothetical protein